MEGRMGRGAGAGGTWAGGGFFLVVHGTWEDGLGCRGGGERGESLVQRPILDRCM